MPYKIYTYANPYELYKTDFWTEIQCVPHFCNSRVLVRGLLDIPGMRKKVQGLICPFDDFVNDIYGEWTQDIGRRIKQYSVVSKELKELHDKGKVSAELYQAFKHNQGELLDALRLFIELGISPQSLHSNSANIEQKVFIYLLKKLQGNKTFSFPEYLKLEDVKNSIQKLAINEKEEFLKILHKRNSKKEVIDDYTIWFDNCISNTNKQSITKVVVHGLNQFTPAQLRLILALDILGIEIIFLYNYQSKYSKIYDSWDYIYKHFSVPIHHDRNVTEYRPSVTITSGHALALALGEIVQGRMDRSDKKFTEWYKLYSKQKIIEFDNVTEYAGFVSRFFDKAVQKAEEQESVILAFRTGKSTENALRYMEELIYTANREVHDLLKIYYPNYAKDRHFLAYPIGQFFSSLYRLWNLEKGEINMDTGCLRECLSAGVLKTAPSERLLREYYTLSFLCDSAKEYSLFKKLMVEYKKLYRQVNTIVVEPEVYLKQLSIYNKEKISEQEIDEFCKAIDEINTIAKELFSSGDGKDEYINFGEHFDKLEKFIKDRKSDLILKEEQLLVEELLERLERVKPGKSDRGTMDDLKKGLYFYLKQKNENHVDWIVRNFEQIDGDILRSRKQHQENDKKIYHFACVSDRDMNKSIDELLPWPLTDRFIRKAYSPIDLQFQVYYASLSERSNFLKYALFYGLYYNECDVELSYVKRYGDETTEPYFLLKLLGIEKQYDPILLEKDTRGPLIRQPEEHIASFRPTDIAAIDMFLCPYRYLLNNVLNPGAILDDDLLYQKLYENLLIAKVSQRISNQPKSMINPQLTRFIAEESKNLKVYFPFWIDTIFNDLEIRAKNYLLYSDDIESYKTRYPEYDAIHSKIRVFFGLAKFIQDISVEEPKNRWSSFEALTEKEGVIKTYRLHKITKANLSTFVPDMLSYLNNAKESGQIVGDWCSFCSNKEVCLKLFLHKESVAK
jgi:hypothetical protein